MWKIACESWLLNVNHAAGRVDVVDVVIRKVTRSLFSFTSPLSISDIYRGLSFPTYYNYIHNLNTQAMSSPTNFPSSGRALVTVTEPKPSIFVLAYLGAQTPDNRLTPEFLTAVLEALNFVEKKWEDISMGDNVGDGAALISTAALDSKIFSNG